MATEELVRTKYVTTPSASPRSASARSGSNSFSRTRCRMAFIMPQNAYTPEVTLTFPGYAPARGVVIQPDGGDVLVRHGESGVEILADPTGLRDLARWFLALADEQVPDSAHVHVDPGTAPLTTSSAPLLISREYRLAI